MAILRVVRVPPESLPSQNLYIMALTEATIGAIGSAAAAAIGTGASAAAQSSLNKKTREFNREEAEKQRLWSEKMFNEQNAWNYEMWLRQNEYNNPENQLARLRDAGLNPLYYGLDGSSAGDLSAAQPLGYERATVGNQVNPLSGFEDVAMKVAQIANIQADTAKKNNENLTETQRREKLVAEIEVTKQELQNKLADEKLTDAQRREIEKGLEWTDRLNEAVLAEKKANAALSESQKNRIDELLEGEKIIQAKTIQDFDEKWKKIHAEIGKIAKETGLAQLDIENYALNHLNNGFMGTGLSLNNVIRGFAAGSHGHKDGHGYGGESTDPMQIAREGQ